MSGPTSANERLVVLDQLRGFAVLGILIVNVQAFAMPSIAVVNPTSYGDLHGFNLMAWLATHVLAEQKFLSLFCMLFGAGIVLQADRAIAAGRDARQIHHNRMFGLIFIGLCHAYLLWFGDILFFYGLTGLLLFPLRRHGPTALLLMAFVALSIPTLLSLGLGWSLPYWPASELEALRLEWRPGVEELAREIAAYKGDWLMQMRARVPEAAYFQSVVFGLWGFWRIAGLMLIGMAFMKMGVLTGLMGPQFYVRAILLGALIGYPMIAYGVWENFGAQWSVEYSMFYGGIFNYWGSLAVAMAYLSAVLLFSERLSAMVPAVLAVGRTALSNYLLQTVICVFLFYGHGLGWFGDLSRGGQLWAVVAIWVFQLGASSWWLQQFRYGPVEWLWRSWTYRQLQPFRLNPP